MADASEVIVRPIQLSDRETWEQLWAGYLTFYRADIPPETTAATWHRINGGDLSMGGIVADTGTEVIGFAHYVLHPTTWTTTNACYLEDLFVSTEHRGTG